MKLSHTDVIRFAEWSRSLGRTPTVDEIRVRYPRMSRAAAYRLRNELLEAWGIEPTGSYLRTTHAPEAWAA